MGKLNNCTDSSIPAVKMFWNHLQTQPNKSLVTAVLKNPLWSKVRKINHLTNRISRSGSHQLTAAPKELTNEVNESAIEALDQESPNVAGSIDYVPHEGFRHFMKPGAIRTRKTKVTILRWLIGGVCLHSRCKSCGEVLSRQHGLTCSGAEECLLTEFGSLLHEDEYPHLNILDRLLNKYRSSPPTEHAEYWYESLEQAIAMVYRNCLGYQQADNGFWSDSSRTQAHQDRVQRRQGDPNSREMLRILMDRIDHVVAHRERQSRYQSGVG